MALSTKIVPTIGCDPELFIRNSEGRLTSAHGLIEGDKKNPHKVNYGAVQVDGMALEFNTDPVPIYDHEAFIRNINSVMKSLKAMVPGYSFVLDPVAVFDKQHFDAQPEVAKELGCDPDFNAWDNSQENPRPDNRTTMRTASGHVHIGFLKNGVVEDLRNREYTSFCETLVKEMDVYLGLPSVLYDKDSRRRNMYGRAGAFRFKPSYGVEYRVLSNAWLRNEKLMKFVMDASDRAYTNVVEGVTIADVIGRDSIEDAINNSNVRMARELCRAYGIPRAA